MLTARQRCISSLRDTFQDERPGVRVDETILVLFPAVHCTLNTVDSVLGNHTRNETKVAEDMVGLWRDCFDALAFLHAQKPTPIMHRDDKPANIGVRLGDGPRAILLDLGHAIQASSSDDHHKGTLRYLAPETMALKNESKLPSGSKPQNYATPVDVYGAAVAFGQVLWGYSPTSSRPWPCDSLEDHRHYFRLRLRTYSNEQGKFLDKQVVKAAAWDPKHRPSAAHLFGEITAFQDAYKPKRKEPTKSA